MFLWVYHFAKYTYIHTINTRTTQIKCNPTCCSIWYALTLKARDNIFIIHMISQCSEYKFWKITRLKQPMYTSGSIIDFQESDTETNGFHKFDNSLFYDDYLYQPLKYIYYSTFKMHQLILIHLNLCLSCYITRWALWHWLYRFTLEQNQYILIVISACIFITDGGTYDYMSC